MTTFLKLFLLFFAATLLFPQSIQAHSSITGATYADGSHIVMITYNVHEPQARVPILYNIRLYERENGRPIAFEYVEMEVKRETTVVMKKQLPMTTNTDAILRYEYARDGMYTISLRFIDHGKQISSAEFPIVVEEAPDTNNLSFLLPTTIAFVLGMLTMKFVILHPRVQTLVMRSLKKLRRKK